MTIYINNYSKNVLWMKMMCKDSVEDTKKDDIILATKRLKLLTAAAAAAKSFQSCPTLCDPRDGSPPGSPIPGVLQARTLEWVAFLCHSPFPSNKCSSNQTPTQSSRSSLRGTFPNWFPDWLAGLLTSSVSSFSC